MIDIFKKLKPYIISVAIALAVGGLSALATKDSMNIYETIIKPAIAPPPWVFPVVWTILFLLMGISAALVYVNRANDRDSAIKGLFIYAVSLIVNFFWSIIFFNLRAYLFAVIWLILLIIAVAMTIFWYRKVDKKAAYLQIPYFLWTLFALYLTIMIYLLNS